MARPPESYRSERRRLARKHGIEWRDLPRVPAGPDRSTIIRLPREVLAIERQAKVTDPK